MDATVWFVAYTAAKAEKRAAKELERVGFETFAPVMRATRQWRGRRFEVERLVFSRYLFVGMKPVCTWRDFRRACGVEAVLANEGRPLPIALSIVEGLRAATAEGAFTAHGPEPVAPGAQVRILGGALAGLDGVCATMRGDRRVDVVVNLFNQPTTVRMTLDRLVSVGPSSASGQPALPYRIDIGPIRATGSRKAS